MGKTSSDKRVSKDQIRSLFRDGQTVMIGGFNKVGAPGTLMQLMYESGAKDLTLICNNCSNDPEGIWFPAAKMIQEGRVRTLRISFTRTNTDLPALEAQGKVQIEMIAQGTLAERVRAGAYGLGGILCHVGYGTLVGEGKQVIEVDGKPYLLELPLRADVALVKATKADKMGNAVCRGTSKNFNTLMAPAADLTLMEAQQIVEVGSLVPDDIDIPSIFVDHLIQTEVEPK